MASRKHHLKNRYGLTEEAYDSMLRGQGGVCAICKKPPKGGRTSNRSLHVDHDHATGAVRGLLCINCNHGLGKFQDDPALLSAAAKYLVG